MMIGDLKIPGSSRFPIGFDLAVGWSMEIASDDLSGRTSNTDKADRGIKAKRLSGAFSVRQDKDELDYLTRFLNLAEETDSSGDMQAHVVVHPLVQASRIRQMRFVGRVQVQEHNTMRQYDVQFELEEVNSIPEAVEHRKASAANPADAALTETFAKTLARLEKQVKS